MSDELTRRSLLTAAGFGAAGLAGIGILTSDRASRVVVDAANALTRSTEQRILSRKPLAREFSAADISPEFPVNGTTAVKGDAYKRLVETGFADWRLRVTGLVRHKLALSLGEIRRLRSRTQTTMHCCDEGWSAVAQWTGVPLGLLLATAGLLPQARYVVFHCLDEKPDGKRYYESIDLFDAFHPQTILAYGMNGGPLPAKYGAPLRLRVETQIGYKNAKFIDRIELVDRLTSIGDGRGGWWEDIDNAVWYAGQ